MARNRKSDGRSRGRVEAPKAAALEPPAVDGFVLVVAGTYGEVWLSDDDHEAFRDLTHRTDQTSMRETVTLRRHFERFAEKGPAGFDSDAFKPQGAKKAGHKKVQVFGFKAYQYRVYGTLKNRNGIPCFVGLSTDPSKQQNKADSALVEKAAANAARWPF